MSAQSSRRQVRRGLEYAVTILGFTGLVIVGASLLGLPVEGVAAAIAAAIALVAMWRSWPRSASGTKEDPPLPD
jgi:hypothetical protein